MDYSIIDILWESDIEPPVFRLTLHDFRTSDCYDYSMAFDSMLQLRNYVFTTLLAFDLDFTGGVRERSSTDN